MWDMQQAAKMTQLYIYDWAVQYIVHLQILLSNDRQPKYILSTDSQPEFVLPSARSGQPLYYLHGRKHVLPTVRRVNMLLQTDR